jgi:nucleoside-diphosphate-sugar epimerase
VIVSPPRDQLSTPGGRALVTGARGFIGRELVASLLKSGVDVIATTRGLDRACTSRLAGRQFELHNMDPCVEDSVRDLLGRFRPKAVFHLSGQARPERALENPAAAFEANTRSVWVLLEAIRQITPTTNLVIVSSADLAKPDHDAGHPYFASKVAAESVATAYAARYGLRVAAARLSHVYGPDEDANRLVTAVIFALLKGDQLRLKEPQRRFDLVFITDVTNGLVAASHRVAAGRLEVFTLATGVTVAGEDVATLASRLAGGEGEVALRVPVRRSRPPGRRPSGWRPGVSLQAGLAATIQWYRNQMRELQHA